MPPEAYPSTLECPSCGDDGAESDDEGYFYDGQGLVCGCSGHVSVSEGEDPRISIDDDA